MQLFTAGFYNEAGDDFIIAKIANDLITSWNASEEQIVLRYLDWQLSDNVTQALEALGYHVREVQQEPPYHPGIMTQISPEPFE